MTDTETKRDYFIIDPRGGPEAAILTLAPNEHPCTVAVAQHLPDSAELSATDGTWVPIAAVRQPPYSEDDLDLPVIVRFSA